MIKNLSDKFLVRTVIIYFVFSALWIYFTDTFVLKLGLSAETLNHLQTYKGLLFISISTFVLVLLLRNYISAVNAEKLKREESELKFKNLAERANDLIYVLSINTSEGFIFISPSVEKITGYKTTDFYNDPQLLDKLIHPDDLKKYKQVNTNIESETPMIVRWIKKNGTVIWMEQQNVPIFNSRNELFAVQSIVRDISQRIFDQNKIRESEARYRKLFESNPVPILVFNREDLKFIDVNSAAIKKYGYEREEFLDISLIDILKDIYDLNDYLKYLKGNEVVQIKEPIRHKLKSGAVIDIEEISQPIQYLGKQSRIAIINDVTEKKKIMKELVKAKEAAEVSEKLKTEFLAQISHEIRTPLNAVISYTGLLSEECSTKTGEEFKFVFQGIENSSARIIRTIDQILNMSELQNKSYRPKFERIDINNIADSCVRELKHLAHSKGLKIKLITSTNEKIIFADEYSISQIIINLLDNAIKYTPEGKVELIIDEIENDRIRMRVVDTGIGMKKEFLENLFKAFSQEETGYTRKYDGSGLGLTLVKNYCELNNAEIFVESEKGKGSVFTVLFNIQNA